MQSGKYGCCPLPQAVCCSDGEHCCPHASKCHVQNGTCTKPQSVIHSYKSKYKMTKFTTLQRSNDMCPDRKTRCPPHDTCCKLKSGGFGCCLYEKASCCSDGQHCCPQGTKCDVIHQRCVRSTETNDLDQLEMLSIEDKHSNLSNVICPGGQYQCPDYNTCCKVGVDEYGCCPLQGAVCCADFKHCCPPGTSCSSQGCIQRSKSQHDFSSTHFHRFIVLFQRQQNHFP